MSTPSTITEQIENVQSLEISYRTLHVNTTLADEETSRIIEIPYRSLIDKYHDFFDNILVVITLPEELQMLYKFNPKRVSFDLYGTTELWAEILTLNGCISILDFKPVDLFVYNTEQFKPLINEMMILEKII